MRIRDRYLMLSFVIVILFLNSCTKTQQTQQTTKTVPVVSSEDVSALTPEEVVALYYQSLNDEQYDVMYSLISDGFKKIEPTSKTFDEFRSYMEKFFDTALGVRSLEVKEALNDGTQVSVDYKIEILRKDGTKKEFSSTFTLKKRANGWKLIHPYGDKIDTS